jgi:tetratricopeptide (TPR) repeat protein
MVITRSLPAIIGVAASLFLTGPGFGQHGGSNNPAPPSTGGATTPGGSTGPRGPGVGTTTGPGTIGTQPGTETPRPIFLTGRVMMDDGAEVPRNIVIERFCGGNPHAEGHTDSKGYFSIQLGQTLGNFDALQDASTDGLGGPGGFGRAADAATSGSPYSQPLLFGCELRARLAGYQSQSVNLTQRQSFDNPDIGTILLHRIAPTEGTTVSATTLAAPKNARKALQKGLDLEKKNKIEQARASFQQAVEFYPNYAEAWFQLGRMQEAEGQVEPARKSFDEAIRSDTKFVPPYIEISTMDFRAQRWQEVADITDKALRLDSFTFPQAFFFNAVANYNLHHEDQAEQSARRAQKLDTRHQIPQLSQLLGMILANRRDYAGAASELRDYLKFAPQANDAPAVRAQLEALEKQTAGTAPPQD